MTVDVLNILSEQPERILLLEGETHLVSAKIVARTNCKIDFDNEVKLQACVNAIKQSGEITKKKIQEGEGVLYTWDKTFREGLSIIFSVAWHDRDFFESRKDAWQSGLHTSIFEKFDISENNVTIEHETYN